ncbi:MAG: nickel pincer cofactor biosynthesis protein LarC [Vicinamibacteria bacterium]
MRQSAYIDAPTGIAGDMAVGALLDLGFPVEEVAARVHAMGVPGLEVRAEKVTRAGLAGTKYHVHAPHGHEHRGLADIRRMLEKAGLAPAAKAIALDAFERLAVAEARLHDTTPEKVHFHEVGAADAIADVVGFATAWAGLGLGVGAARVSPLPFTRGRIDVAHGALPVPAPATLALLEGFAWQPSPLEGELVTPTGAALLAAVARPGDPGPFRLRKTGHGAGTREIPGTPNLLRVLLVEEAGDATLAREAEESGTRESAVLLETNLDDLTPELAAAVADGLRADGALDVWTSPVQMKKGRPGFVLSVLAAEADLDRLAARLFRESTTLGLRVSRIERRVLARASIEVETPFGRVRAKVGRAGGRVVNVAPEFEDVRAAAARHGVPVKRVLAAAARAAEQAAGADEPGRGEGTR